MRFRPRQLAPNLVLGLLLTATFLCSLTAFGQNVNRTDSAEVSQVTLGIANHFKLGEWAALRIDVTLDQATACDLLEVDSLDGDSMPVTFQQRPIRVDSPTPRLHGWFKLGSARGNLVVRLLDKGKNVLRVYVVSLNQANRESPIRILPPTARIMAFVGVAEKVESFFTAASLATGSDTAIQIVRVDSLDDLPATELGFKNIDALLVSPGVMAAFGSPSPRQKEILTDWIGSGGKFLFWTGTPPTTDDPAQNPFTEFLPGKIIGTGLLKSTSRLDFLIKAKRPLMAIGDKSLTLPKLGEVQGQVLLAQDDIPLIVRKQFGLGQITYSALNLDASPILEWEGAMRLFEQLVLQSKLGVERSGENRISASGYGNLDLVNQLRVPLEQFSQVEFISFTTVALLIGLLIILVGPFDYFVLRGLLGRRMELTWLTFPLIVIGFCGLAVWMSSRYRPAQLQFNQVEMVDVDAISGRVRGTAWTFLYSPESGLHSVGGQATKLVPTRSPKDAISWVTLPGSKSGISLDRSNPPYRVNLNDSGNLEITDLPFPVRSTRSILHEWQAQADFSVRSRLRYESAIGRLGGTFTNPFDFPITNCKIFFENWAYVFDQPIAGGDTVDLLTEARERTVKSILTQRDRLSADGKTQNAPWDPLDLNLRRIAEMIQFHDAAGGLGYTSLTNRVHARLEMSEHLEMKNAILVAELPGPASQILLDQQPLASGFDKRFAFVRISVPVEAAETESGTTLNKK